MALAADHVADRLAAAGVGTVGTDIFALRLPSTPDTCLFVRAMGGRKPARGFGESSPTIAQFPDVQIIVRALDVPTLAAKVDAIRAVLDFKTWTVSGVQYFSSLQYEPVDLGEDENQRQQVSMVFSLTKQ
jgi:hypothetical protein